MTSATPSPSTAPAPETGPGDLILDRVSRRYGDSFAVQEFSLTAPGGGVTAILGASGSGKSTVLRLAAGLETPDAGDIRLGAQLLSGRGVFVPAQKRKIALVFQDYALFPHLTLAGNIAFGRPELGRPESRALAGLWLEKVGLADRIDAFPHQLSGGEQQRVALARALASAPRAVLLDEPFSGLDRDLRLDLRDATLSALREAHVTSVFVTHDAEDAMLAADRIVIVAAGRAVQAGAPREVYGAPVSLYAARALGSVNVAAGRVTASRLDTPFGAFPAPRLADGARALVAVRPEALILVEGAEAQVISRRPAGAFDEVKLLAGGLIWRTQALPGQGPEPGAATGVRLVTAGVHVFEEDRVKTTARAGTEQTASG